MSRKNKNFEFRVYSKNIELILLSYFISDKVNNNDRWIDIYY